MFKYPSIPAHYKEAHNYFGKTLQVLEKIDGANFCIKVDNNGKLSFYSRNQHIQDETNSGLFKEALQIGHLKSEVFSSYPKMFFYFETFGQGIQKRIDYTNYLSPNSINGRDIILIDAAEFEPETKIKRFFSLQALQQFSSNIGIPIPKTKEISNFNFSHIEDLLNQVGIEGYVLRYEEPNKIFRPINHYGELMQFKLKTKTFEMYEKGKISNKKFKTPYPAQVVEWLTANINVGRLHSIYSHGNLELKKEMADMKFLPNLVLEDCLSENQELINEDRHTLLKIVSKLTATALKEYLNVDSSFKFGTI